MKDADVWRYAQHIGRRMDRWIREDAQQEAALAGIEKIRGWADLADWKIKGAMWRAAFTLRDKLGRPLSMGDEDYITALADEDLKLLMVECEFTKDEQALIDARQEVAKRTRTGNVAAAASHLGWSAARAQAVFEGITRKVLGGE